MYPQIFNDRSQNPEAGDEPKPLTADFGRQATYLQDVTTPPLEPGDSPASDSLAPPANDNYVLSSSPTSAPKSPGLLRRIKSSLFRHVSLSESSGTSANVAPEGTAGTSPNLTLSSRWEFSEYVDPSISPQTPAAGQSSPRAPSHRHSSLGESLAEGNNVYEDITHTLKKA